MINKDVANHYDWARMNLAVANDNQVPLDKNGLN